MTVDGCKRSRKQNIIHSFIIQSFIQLTTRQAQALSPALGPGGEQDMIFLPSRAPSRAEARGPGANFSRFVQLSEEPGTVRTEWVFLQPVCFERAGLWPSFSPVPTPAQSHGPGMGWGLKVWQVQIRDLDKSCGVRHGLSTGRGVHRAEE